MQSIRKEIHTLLNNELKALKETLDSLERIGVENIPYHSLLGMAHCLKSRYDYIEDMYHYLTTHPMYKGNTSAISDKFNRVQNTYIIVGTFNGRLT